MKKMFFLGISILGMTNLASAWQKNYPQSWNKYGNSSVVTCYNTDISPCMRGSGSSPSPGQQCSIWSNYSYVCDAIVIRVESSNEDESNDENIPNGGVTVAEVTGEFMPE